MSKQLTEAINALQETAAWQLHEAREANKERRAARQREPRFAAEIEARRRPLRHTRFGSVLVHPPLAVPFERTIPGAFWSQTADQEAEVSCPCKEVAVLALAVPKVCSCERAYLYTGREVRVAFSPLGVDAVPEPDPEPVTPD